MNTNQLKKFAQETRRKLLKQVNGKLEYVMNSDNGALRDKAAVVKELNKELKQLGREALVDKVTYTWFNRFVALRYMDVRGFQPLEISVLSPQQGQVSPQLLQEAMAGHIPAELKVDRQQIMDILDGKTTSSNPENEAYRQLLVASCNHLHAIFPFLFESIDDYTELLLPDDLTSEFSIIHDVINGMSEEDCQQVEILGWLYQFYISEKKDEVFASKEKVSKEDIPAATQLFTPRWIVEYMVQNTVGKLWVLNNPGSRLKEHMPYYIESEVTAEDVLKINKPEELTLLDQACGSGHILVYGFELLYKIYEEEGYAPSEIPKLIIEHNLHGFEIDERAAQLAGLAVLMKAREYQRRLFKKTDVPVPNVTCFLDLTLSDEEIKNTFHNADIPLSDELFHDLQVLQQATNFGSLIIPQVFLIQLNSLKVVFRKKIDKGDLFGKENLKKLILAFEILEKLGKKYCCVVDNPPYMGSGNMNEELSNFVSKKYPYSKWDLMACFMEAGLKNVAPNGFMGMINQETWMFKTSYSDLRLELLNNVSIANMLHLGKSVFKEITGEKVRSTSFSILNSKNIKRGIYYKLKSYKDSESKKQAVLQKSCPIFIFNKRSIKSITDHNWAYWLSEQGENIIHTAKKLNSLAEPRKGITTANDGYFLKYWYEIPIIKIGFNQTPEKELSHKFYPVNKGGGFRKWYGLREYVIMWKDDGYEIKNFRDDNGKLRSRPQNLQYNFKEGVTWTSVSSSGLTCRFNEIGLMMTDNGATIYNSPNHFITLSILNSKIGQYFLSVLTPGFKYDVGVINKFPIIESLYSIIGIANIAKQCVEISSVDWNSIESSWDFQHNELIRFNNEGGIETLEEATDLFKQYWTNKFYQLHENEEELNRQFIEIYGLQDELTPDVPLSEITILQEELDSKELKKLEKGFRSQRSEVSRPPLPFKDKEIMVQFVSYAVGCMFGRYSLDKEGLILANQGETVRHYKEKIGKQASELSYLPDESNIIPLLDDEWFQDDIVARFNEFLKVTFGEANFSRNLDFIEEKLGRDMRSWFAKEFYKDHVQRYKKRPIYWKFSSPKGSFSVLIYMHRYTPDTLNVILNSYLREFINKLSNRKEQMQHLENTGTASEKTQASKEIDKLNKMLADCQEYERDILYPLASDRIGIDLDDGVLVNYNLFGTAIEQITGLNDPKTKKKVKGFDWIDGERVR